MTIWFDADDLIEYFQYSSHPTGIQRLSLEIYRAVCALAPEQTGFCRRGSRQGCYQRIEAAVLEAMIAAAAARPAAQAASPTRPWQSYLAALAGPLPLTVREPLGRLYRAIRAAGRAGLDLLAACFHAAVPKPRDTATQAANGPDIMFEPGDWFINLGASFNTRYETESLRAFKADGVRLAFFAHDMIPVLFPEWCMPPIPADFRRWLREIVPLADLMVTNSRNTADDLTACLTEQGLKLPRAVVLPVGSRPLAPATGPALWQRPYILMVGTLEVRKNLTNMLRVWRKLLQTMPAETVPDLVLAGKIGWLTADVRQQFENCNWLDGKIGLVASPSEADLANLYQNCLFTVFPSLYEGWGLPVTESLSAGKPVAASRRGAIVEAGGPFCVYFDPENVSDMTKTIRRLIEAPEQVAALSARITAEFQPPSWEDTASCLLAELNGADTDTPAAALPLKAAS